MIFQNQKIWRTRGEVHIDHGCQRSHRIVRRDHHVMRLGYRRDLLQLQDPARQTNIGLHDVGRLFRQQLPEIMLRVQALTGRERNLHPLFERLHGVHVFHADRLFEKIGMHRFQGLGHLRRANRLEQRGMRVEGQVHIRTHCVSNSLGTLPCRTGHRVIRHGLRPGRMRRHLDRRVPILRDQRFGVFGKLRGSSAAGALIDAHAVAALASQQHVDRKARRFSGDVPQRVLDAADGGVDHRASRKAREVVHGGPEILDIARILAHQPRFEIFNGGDSRLIGADRVGLTEAEYSRVCEHFHEAEIAPARVHQKTLDVGDLQLRLAGISRGRLRHGLSLQGQSDSSTLDQKVTTFHGRYCT